MSEAEAEAEAEQKFVEHLRDERTVTLKVSSYWLRNAEIETLPSVRAGNTSD